MEQKRPEDELAREQPPDVSADRVPDERGGAPGKEPRHKRAPLEIREIENLEDDAKGG